MRFAPERPQRGFVPKPAGIGERAATQEPPRDLSRRAGKIEDDIRDEKDRPIDRSEHRAPVVVVEFSIEPVHQVEIGGRRVRVGEVAEHNLRLGEETKKTLDRDRRIVSADEPDLRREQPEVQLERRGADAMRAKAHCAKLSRHTHHILRSLSEIPASSTTLPVRAVLRKLERSWQ